MNKFQKVALQMAKDDKSSWSYKKALDFKNWNKAQMSYLNK